MADTSRTSQAVHQHQRPEHWALVQDLDDKETWHKLGVEALRQGNHQIVEFSYQVRHYAALHLDYSEPPVSFVWAALVNGCVNMNIFDITMIDE